MSPPPQRRMRFEPATSGLLPPHLVARGGAVRVGGPESGYDLAGPVRLPQVDRAGHLREHGRNVVTVLHLKVKVSRSGSLGQTSVTGSNVNVTGTRSLMGQ